MLKALAQPLPETRFYPTGGITAANASTYLGLPQVACVEGSRFAKDASLKARDVEVIAELFLDAVDSSESMNRNARFSPARSFSRRPEPCVVPTVAEESR